MIWKVGDNRQYSDDDGEWEGAVVGEAVENERGEVGDK